MNSLLDLPKPREPKDLDMCATVHTDDIKNLGFHFAPTGEKHGTITLIRGDVKVEVTTTREDQGHGDNRKDVEPVFCLDNALGPYIDVQRRDLTINGLLCEPSTGIIHDHVGGIDDIKKGHITLIGRTVKRLQEDALRVMRFVRFWCSTGFTLDPNIFHFVTDSLFLKRLKLVSGERIRDELLGILSTERAAMGMRLLQELGIIAIWLPEMEQLVDMKQNVWHSEDVWEHSLLALEHAIHMGGDLTDRVATLFHDVGKGVTRDVKTLGSSNDGDVERQLREYGYSFHGHDAESVRILDELICPRLKLYGSTDKYNVDMDRAKHIIGRHMSTFSTSKMTTRKRLKHLGATDYSVDMVDRSFRLFIADTCARELDWDYPLGYPKADPMWVVLEKGARIRRSVLDYLAQEHSARTVKDVRLNGNDVMGLLGLKPSRTVGKVLYHLFDLVTSESIENDPVVLEQYLINNKEMLLDLPEEK
jgi:tRNA nucleotidyltransferase/poly(A) polymerase